MSIKTRLKTKKTKAYKIVKMGIKSGGSMDRINRRINKNQTIGKTKNTTQKN